MPATDFKKTWFLRCAGVERSLADWGVDAASVTTGNQVADVLSLGTSATYKGEQLFATGATVELIRADGTGAPRREFAGRVTPPRRSADGGTYNKTYEISGPWWYFENKVYREIWEAAGGIYKARAVLTYDEEGQKMPAADCLLAVINYVIAQGAPLAVGDLSAITGTIPAEEVRNLTCAEVMTRILRWFPDVVLWFDYAAPVPTINASRISSAPVVDFSLAEWTVQRLNYARRDDIRKAGVAIQYERIDTIDGEQIPADVMDVAGDVSGFNVLETTVSLTGANVSYTTQKLKSELIRVDSAEWLRNHIKELEGVLPSAITVVSSIITMPDQSLAYEVIEGAHAEWMGGVSGTATVQARLIYKTGNVTETGDFSIELRATSKPSGTYRTLASETPSEPTPEGLAQQIFDALNRDHWEGSFTIVEQVAGRWDLIGKAVRMSDRAGALLFGPAQVQGVAVNLATGSTVVSFGPTPILSSGDLVSMLRSTRGRIYANGRIKMSSGGGSAVGAGEATANNSSGGRHERKHQITVGTGEAAKTVTVDMTSAPALPSAPAALTVQLREGYVVVNGQLRRILVPMTEDFSATV